MGIARDSKGTYRLTGRTTEEDVLAAAEGVLRSKLERLGAISSPRDASDFVRMRLSAEKSERFELLHLDNRHRILAIETLFYGTIDGSSVHPREVVRSVLAHNSAAVILVHNHPSGIPTASAADKAITRELISALSMVGCRTLDHLIVGGMEVASMASEGLM